MPILTINVPGKFQITFDLADPDTLTDDGDTVQILADDEPLIGIDHEGVICWPDGENAKRLVAFGPQRYTARFYPQAWIKDHAVGVDAQGDVEWDVTEAVHALPADYRAELLREIDDDSDHEALDRDDLLQSDPRAPRWVREWNGPFSIRIRESETT